MKPIISPAARDDVAWQRDWYKRHATTAVSKRFVDCVRKSIEALAGNRMLGNRLELDGLDSSDAMWHPVERFERFLVYFVRDVHTGKVTVHRVLDGSRNTGILHREFG